MTGDMSLPGAGLSLEDEVVVKRWRDEVGDERLRRIAVALTVGRPGRKSEEPDRKHLLLMMAGFSRVHPNASANRLAQMVVDSPEGMAEQMRANTAPEALNRWLRDKWKKHSTELKSTITATEQRASIINPLRSFETFLQLVGNVKTKSGRLPRFEETLQQSLLSSSDLPSIFSSRNVAALENCLTGPVPLGFQVFLESPGFGLLKAALGPKDKVAEAVRLLLPPPLEKTPGN